MKKCFLVAGGTGGHINSAIALSEYLKSKNIDSIFLTGRRELDYKLLKNYNKFHLNAWPLRSNNPITQIKSIFLNIFAFFQTIYLILIHKPIFLFGAGGYVCGPSLLAGKILGKKIYIIEQNAVMGVTNKIVSKFADKIFVNFSQTKGITDTELKKVINSGNPTRSTVAWKPSIQEDEVKILIIGGSLGADQINQSMEYLLGYEFQKKIHIKHQVGLNKKFNIQNINKNIKYEQLEYLENIQNEYSWCNIVISRAGASAISELRIMERPSILIPFPAATDNHQEINANILKNENRFDVYVLDKKLVKNHLADQIYRAINSIIDKNNLSINEKKNLDTNPCNIIWDHINHE